MSSIIHEGADSTDPYEDVGIIIEGAQMPENLNNVANACSVMLGLHFKRRPEVHF